MSNRLDPNKPHPRDPLGRTPEQIDDAIDAWHEGPDDGTPMHVALGWTWEEYVRWASPDALATRVK